MRISENLFIVINIIIVLMYIWFIIRSYRRASYMNYAVFWALWPL